MATNTKVGMVIILAFLIGIGGLLSRQVDRGTQQQGGRGDGLAHLVMKRPERTPPRPSSGEQASPARPRAAGGRGSVHFDRPISLSGLDRPVPPEGPGREVRQASPPTRSLVDRPAPAAGRSRGGMGLERAPAFAGPAPAVVRLDVGPVSVPDLPPGWTLHKVESGETLGAISTKYYQTCRKYDLIFLANRDRLTDANRIRAGMKLRIPPLPGGTVPGGARPAEGSSPAPPPRRLLDSPLLERVGPGQGPSGATLMARPRPSSGPTGAIYRVREGDTLSSIAAAMLGSRRQWRALWRMNKDVVPDPDRLAIGLVIRLPETRLAMQNP